MMKKVLFAMMVAGQLLAQQAVAADKLTVGLIAVTEKEDVRKRWQPLIDDLSKATGQEVQVVISPNYAEIVDGLKANTIQMAWLSNKVALDAVESGKATVFARMVKADGSKGYQSVLITQTGSALKSTDQMFKEPGVYQFAYGDSGSTSGYLVPEYYLFSKNKVEPAKLFKKVIQGDHASNLKAVLSKTVDVATYNTESLDMLKKEAPADFNRIRVIWTSPQIPNDPLLYRKDLPQGTKNKLEDFFTNYGKGKNAAAQKDTLKKILNLSGFQRSNDAQLKPIADLTLFSILRTNMNDTKLSPQEKQKRFDEVSARFGKLSAILESSRLN
ncbi:phosphate/phosphite/phosphonate ABC transporter substrate-binding protein [Undibacterium luofuense]|uniref:Phosphate/phosphite/phosphonate ABC transporter substrate-binding protein n=1 Tax=Undibacterium luofuense TaxID=2828733 RepID=A0A941DN66_9BURK|nr:phosphate/phosphite/phosphonate ABC transporter substrate-binding protein [Undibacterium luofuense]MBR7783973.1 phosphate/phosphite/phosphonate ABC transporter substrate-binding protein [Undibacterium luofuense]